MTPEDVKAIREALGWTQERMAMEMEFNHRSQVHQLETGKRKIVGPKLALLRQLKARADEAAKKAKKK